MAAQSLDQILRILKDGRWHGIDEIVIRTEISPPKMQIIAEFLAKFDFVQMDRQNGKVRISRYAARFFHQASSLQTGKRAKPTRARSKYGRLEEKTAL